jgi:hypothetical protein
VIHLSTSFRRCSRTFMIFLAVSTASVATVLASTAFAEPDLGSAGPRLGEQKSVYEAVQGWAQDHHTRTVVNFVWNDLGPIAPPPSGGDQASAEQAIKNGYVQKLAHCYATRNAVANLQSITWDPPGFSPVTGDREPFTTPTLGWAASSWPRRLGAADGTYNINGADGQHGTCRQTYSKHLSRDPINALCSGHGSSLDELSLEVTADGDGNHYNQEDANSGADREHLGLDQTQRYS